MAGYKSAPVIALHSLGFRFPDRPVSLLSLSGKKNPELEEKSSDKLKSSHDAGGGSLTGRRPPVLLE